MIPRPPNEPNSVARRGSVECARVRRTNPVSAPSSNCQRTGARGIAALRIEVTSEGDSLPMDLSRPRAAHTVAPRCADARSLTLIVAAPSLCQWTCHVRENSRQLRRHDAAPAFDDDRSLIIARCQWTPHVRAVNRKKRRPLARAFPQSPTGTIERTKALVANPRNSSRDLLDAGFEGGSRRKLKCRPGRSVRSNRNPWRRWTLLYSHPGAVLPESDGAPAANATRHEGLTPRAAVGTLWTCGRVARCARIPQFTPCKGCRRRVVGGNSAPKSNGFFWEVARVAIVVKDLIDAGVHFGHRASRWNPKMKPYIYGKRNLIHIIDLKETVRGLAAGEQVLPTGRFARTA